MQSGIDQCKKNYNRANLQTKMGTINDPFSVTHLKIEKNGQETQHACKG